MLQKSMIKLLSIADLISITNAILGFLAIIMIFLNEVHYSFSLILLAMIADGIDGLVARRTKHSNLGEYMEAMGDMISLVIAPALFVYQIYSKDIIISNNNFQHLFLIIVLTIFLFFNILRLGSFHIMKKEKIFIGLPASASTIIIIILSYLRIEYVYILLIILIISIILISNIRFPKPNYIINIFAAILIIFSIIFGSQYNGITLLILLISIIIYSIFGPIYIHKSTKS
ncbi:MAG: CDP-alcohol phosphatidyltransferase family protein [Candidatus Thermoplasmatota archaeon]